MIFLKIIKDFECSDQNRSEQYLSYYDSCPFGLLPPFCQWVFDKSRVRQIFFFFFFPRLPSQPFSQTTAFHVTFSQASAVFYFIM